MPTAQELREAFDASFALPPPGEAPEAEKLLLIRVAGDRYAVRMQEAGGVARTSTFSPLASRKPACAGLLGIRGEAVPVFRLDALLGYGDAAFDAGPGPREDHRGAGVRRDHWMTKDPYRYFRVEAREILDGLTQGALSLRRGTADPELLPRLLRLAHTLKGAARVVRQGAIAERAHAVEDLLAPYRDAPGTIPPDRVEELVRGVDAISAKVAEIGPVPGPAAAAESADAAFETVHVELGDMDALLASLDEGASRVRGLRPALAQIARARRLSQAIVGLAAAAGDGGGAQGRTSAAAEELRTVLENAERELSRTLESAESGLGQAGEEARRLRLLPASTVFPLLGRAARDAAEAVGRRIEFEAEGGDHRLDAPVLLGLRDALGHVVRNAVAHGVEAEGERAAAGKPPSGRIRVRVGRRGARVFFACEDDGRGIDVEAIRRAAAGRGRPAPPEGASLEEAVQFLLRGGVSTGPLTGVAGRGIGLDVVRETAARLKGEVRIESRRGAGTVVTLEVPVSLSAIAALEAEAGGSAVLFPADAVVRAVRPSAGEIIRSAEGVFLSFQDEAVPFLALAGALGARNSVPEARDGAPAVVLKAGPRRIAVGVDRVVGLRAALVRPVPEAAAAEPWIAGVSLDAAGRPIAVLDPAGLEAAVKGTVPSPRAAVPAPLRLLVVDDSLTTRMLEQSILEAAGYEVDLAVCGEEAIEKARAADYRLFLVDIEMPGMDGFALLGRLRDDPRLREVPAILVTSRGSPEDRRRGLEAGARAYIAKGEFDQEEFLGTIRRLTNPTYS